MVFVAVVASLRETGFQILSLARSLRSLTTQKNATRSKSKTISAADVADVADVTQMKTCKPQKLTPFIAVKTLKPYAAQVKFKAKSGY
jgi:NADP-dependent 3-hydroxy acid dehydrogenase YdfG